MSERDAAGTESVEAIDYEVESGFEFIDDFDAEGDELDDHERHFLSAMARDSFRDAHSDLIDRREVVARLISVRKRLKLSQKEVAERMQTSQSTVSEFETNSADPHYSTLQRYARACTVKLVSRIEFPVDCAWLTDAYREPSIKPAAITGGSRPSEVMRAWHERSTLPGESDPYRLASA